MTSRSRSKRRPHDKTTPSNSRSVAKSGSAKKPVRKTLGKVIVKHAKAQVASDSRSYDKTEKRKHPKGKLALKSESRTQAKTSKPSAKSSAVLRRASSPVVGKTKRRATEVPRGRAVKTKILKGKSRGSETPVVDKRQLSFSFAAPSSVAATRASSGPQKKLGKPERKPRAVESKPVPAEAEGTTHSTEHAAAPGANVPPTSAGKPAALPVPAPPAPVLSPVPISMTRLEAALERENQRRAERDRGPDSTARGLPIGVRRGRLMPRSERMDAAPASSRSHSFDALARALAGAGIVADPESLRTYLNPWLNGSDVLAFVPADRAAIIACASVSVDSRKKVLIVVPSEENVTDQVLMLNSAGLEAKTLPHQPDERGVESRALARNESLTLVMSLEQLIHDDVIDDTRKILFDLIAIDECQRVSELAPDFDPGLERLADLAPRLGRPPTLSLLRAVPPSVRSDLPHRLGLRNPLRVDLPPVHETLSLDVISTDPNRRIAQLIEQLRGAMLPAVVLGHTVADVTEIQNALLQAGFDARRMDYLARPAFSDPNAQTVWVIAQGRVSTPIQFAHTLIHYRSPSSLEQYCRELGWLTHTSGKSRSTMLVSSDDESLVKGSLERARPRAEDLAGLASVLARHGSNASTVLIDSLCSSVGMNRTRVEALVQVFARAGWVEHSQDWVRLRPDCPDLVDRARGLGARLKTARERDAQRLRSLSAYVVSRGCRQESLRRHFGTAGSRPCGLCDACRSGRVSMTDNPRVAPLPPMVPELISLPEDRCEQTPPAPAVAPAREPSPHEPQPPWGHSPSRRRIIRF